MLGLRMWQFVLAWVFTAVLCELVALLIVGIIWGVNFSAAVGGLAGGALAATLMAFAYRDRLRIRAGEGSGVRGRRPRPRR
jgi:membrane associated rhomboid family serine protease